MDEQNTGAWTEVPWDFHIESTSRRDVEEMIARREEKNTEFLASHPDYNGVIEPYVLSFNPVTGMYSNIVCYPLSKPP